MATTRSGKDACDLLDADHRAIKKMFKDYEELTGSRARSAAQKKLDLAHRICRELTLHEQIEEEIFYPALRAATKDTALIDRAQVEHQTIRHLIAQVERAAEADGLVNAQIKVLGQYVDHHVKAERSELFARARSSCKLDLVALRDELERRREELAVERVPDMGELAV